MRKEVLVGHTPTVQDLVNVVSDFDGALDESYVFYTVDDDGIHLMVKS